MYEDLWMIQAGWSGCTIPKERPIARNALSCIGVGFSKVTRLHGPIILFVIAQLDPIDYSVVATNALAYSDYSKFDPYLFNTQGSYTHRKEKLFAQWGYSVEDARWLQLEIERQAKEKSLAGEYTLGVLNDKGQRISIRVTIPRRNNGELVSFITGWMIYPNGKIQLTTPYGGK